MDAVANVRPEIAAEIRVARNRPVDGDGDVETEPSEQSDPFFYRDESDWFGHWPDEELVASDWIGLVLIRDVRPFAVGS